MDFSTRPDEPMGNSWTQTDPMWDILRQNEAIDNPGTQNERLDVVLTQQELNDDPDDSSLTNVCQIEKVDTNT